MSTENTIILKGKGGHHEEYVTDEICSPGHAVSLAADGKIDLQVATALEAIKSELILVKEDALQGKTIDDAYAVADQVFVYIPRAGDVVNVLVKISENISIGDKLITEGAGSGLFIEAAGTESRYQLIALEGPGALAAQAHVKCRVL